MRVTIPVEKGSSAIKDGSLPKLMQEFTQKNKPENAYFSTVDGKRTAFFFLNVNDSSQMVALGEPFFSTLNADVQFSPCMNAEDLQRGLETLHGVATAGAR